MENIDDVVKNKKCTGCSACFNICPTDAISMEKDEEGFYSPKIDLEKCIHCGLCNKVCPSLNPPSKDDQFSFPKVYAAWNKNEKIRLESSSGGIFSLLADYFLEKKGYVCGAAFDEENKLKHIIVSNKRDLKKLRGSKYVQSEIGETFKEIKKLLEKDKWVLFSGTPCQAGGLRNFLKKDYEKLLVVDIVCHGVPSPLVFEKYLKEVEKENKTNIKKINFRDKSTGWKSYSFTLSGEKGRVIKERNDENIYFEGFLKNLYLNKICTSCPYSQFPKFSDITLGDYWGVSSYKDQLDDDQGTSVLILNNKKGEETLDIMKTKIKYTKIPKDYSRLKLKSLYLPYSLHPNRDLFFKDFIESGNVINNINKSLETQNTFDVGIFNMRLPTNNFGAILQSYALLKVVTNLGYNAKVINYISKELEETKDKFSLINLDTFRENHIGYTSPCYTNKELIKLNENFKTFIVGSDQVWNYNYLKSAFSDDISKYFLNFVLPTKKILSYAASFAENHWKGNKDEIIIVRDSLSRFTSVSVRERSGIDICRDLFGTKAEFVLDPTLLLDVSHYQSIIDSEKLDNINGRYIAYFTLDENLEKNIGEREELMKYCKENRVNLKNIRGSIKDVLGERKFIYNSIPSWLNLIENSDFVITDSYHCVIFSILFKKEFIFIQREYAGNERLKSLFAILSIKERFLKSIEELNIEELINKKTDYMSIHEKLHVEKDRSLKYLKINLEKDSNLSEGISIIERDIIQAKISIIDYQTRIEEQLIRIQSLQFKIQEEITKNQELENRVRLLNSKTNGLELIIQRYRNSKTLKYAAKIKNLLYKIGFKKYKL